MWFKAEIENIYKTVYMEQADESVHDLGLHADDLQAIREAGSAIHNISNKIFQPKVI